MIDPELHFDPMKLRSGPFLNILQHLDELTFGAIGMTMPRWVFYDCAEVPGGIFGFARPAAELDEWVLRALNVPADYDGMVIPGGRGPEEMRQDPAVLEIVGHFLDKKLPLGAAGTTAIYTKFANAFHIITKITVRIKAWTNYLPI